MHIISGGLDSQLKLFDLNNNTETLIGNHDNSIKCVEYSSKVNGVVTGSWDKVGFYLISTFSIKVITLINAWLLDG